MKTKTSDKRKYNPKNTDQLLPNLCMGDRLINKVKETPTFIEFTTLLISKDTGYGYRTKVYYSKIKKEKIFFLFLNNLYCFDDVYPLPILFMEKSLIKRVRKDYFSYEAIYGFISNLKWKYCKGKVRFDREKYKKNVINKIRNDKI